jgi:hypothetical protein
MSRETPGHLHRLLVETPAAGVGELFGFEQDLAGVGGEGQHREQAEAHQAGRWVLMLHD